MQPSTEIKSLVPVTERPAWKALTAHRQVKNLHPWDLFATDPQRGYAFTIEAEGIYLDCSKNRITGETLQLLFQLGKVVAQRILPELESQTETELNHDSSTNSLIRRYRKLKENL